MILLKELINKRDSFEIIRDQIAGLLVLECENQKVLAAAAQLDPADYNFNVFIERSNPWETFLDEGCQDFTPIVNVWYDGSTFDPSASNIFMRQKTEGVFNIDVYGAGVSKATDNGHASGDEVAARESQRALRLVRNILMGSSNTQLQLAGLVWSRWPQSAKMFQPQSDTRPVNHVIASRLVLNVVFNEFSPQYVPETLEYVAIEISQRSDGQVILQADYEYL
jgi:hypothetical protein